MFTFVVRVNSAAMKKNKLILEQLEKRTHSVYQAKESAALTGGWIKAIRSALGMSLQQLAKKLSVSRQSVQALEAREKQGNISLRSLREVAAAMDMELVYGFVPKEGSLDKYIENKARQMAEQIVARSSTTMKLEDQEVSYERKQKAIAERTAIIKQELPKALWD